jgi:hypothetical protein
MVSSPDKGLVETDKFPGLGSSDGVLIFFSSPFSSILKFKRLITCQGDLRHLVKNA